MDAARKIDEVFKALCFEVFLHGAATHAVMTKNDDCFVFGELLEAFGDIAHGDVDGALNPANFEFYLLANIQKRDRFILIA